MGRFRSKDVPPCRPKSILLMWTMSFNRIERKKQRERESGEKPIARKPVFVVCANEYEDLLSIASFPQFISYNGQKAPLNRIGAEATAIVSRVVAVRATLRDRGHVWGQGEGAETSQNAKSCSDRP